MVNLGFLYQGEGRLDDAIVAYTRAIDSGHPDASARAAAALENLGRTDDG
jgi:tetratricopeptide (TPR) repeat protein